MTTTTTQTASTVPAEPRILPAEPRILSANTYFWTPGTNASTRRRNEERNQAAAADYLEALGFSVTRTGDAVNAVSADGTVEVAFDYSESCHNVYKHLRVSHSGKNSNITAIRKIATPLAHTPETPNFYPTNRAAVAA